MSKSAGLSLTPGRLALLGCLAVAAIAIALLPAPAAAPGAMIGLAIVTLTVALWATNAIPPLYAAVLFFAIALAAQAAPLVPLISGFWSSAAALVLGGLILGGAAERTGLGRYVARALMGTALSTYPRLIAGLLIGTGALSFLVPSTMGRLAITIPIVLALAKEVGYELGSRGHTGLIATTVAGNYLTSYGILPANLTNVIALGALEGLGGPSIQYGEYLAMSMPVLGIIKAVTFWAVVVVACPAPPPAAIPDTAAPNVLSPAARRLAAILAVTVLLWATDFIHHVKPGWVALGAGLVCLIPGLGLANAREVLDLNKLTSVISLAAVLGVATVLTQSGAGGMIAGWLNGIGPPVDGSPAAGYALIAVAASGVAIVATVVGSIAIVTPIVPDIAIASGLPLKAGVIAVLTGLQALPFPFEAVPVMVGLMMGKVPAASTLRILIPLAILGHLLILPLQIGWLRMLGVMP